MYSCILVPLDGSRFSEASLPHAVCIAKRTGARIHLASVHEPIPSFAYDEWESASMEWSSDYLRRVVERLGEVGVEATWTLRNGPVVDELEAEAEAQEADVIVMASHGRGLLSRAWLGSVADAFVHHTDRPILLIRPEKAKEGSDPEADLDRELCFDNVLVPLDGSELSEQALKDAVEFGELFGAGYHLARIVPYPADVTSAYLPHTVQMNQGVVAEAKEAAATYLEAHAGTLRRAGHRVTTGVLVDAQPGHGILRAVENEDCDCVVMATHGRSGLTRAILGSASDKVLRGCHIPLLLHRPKK